MKIIYITKKISAYLISLITSKPLLLSLKENETDGNHPFFKKITNEYFNWVNSPTPKLPIMKQFTIGVAATKIPETSMQLLEKRKPIESELTSLKKIDVHCIELDYNLHIDDIWNIRKSSLYNQGKHNHSAVLNRPEPSDDPISNNNNHNYFYLGVFDKSNQLIAYAGYFVAGDIIEMSHHYIHAEQDETKILALLLYSGMEFSLENHPYTKYLLFGKYIKENTKVQTLIKKLGFASFNANWKLN